MNIQFFGHSIFANGYRHTRSNNQPTTLTEYINEKYKIEGRYTAVPTISYERLLMEIKKYKQPIDFAVISHPDPMNAYFPSWNHDFDSAEIPEDAIEYWINNEDYYFLYSSTKFFSERNMNISTLEKMHWSKVNEKLVEYKKYHYTPDLQKNRSYGALIQIVDYLKYKKIKTIHLIREEFIPSWYKFTYGVVDKKILRFQYDQPYAVSYSKSFNAINAEGNQVAARQIVEYIENYEKYSLEHNHEQE